MSSLLHGLGLFETLRVSGGAPEFLEHHIKRMAGSARFLGLDFSEEGFIAALAEALADRSPDRDWRVRITLFQDDGPRYLAHSEPLAGTPESVNLRLSGYRVFSGNPLCQHKTTSRLLYHLAGREAVSAGFWDALLLNERDEIAETSKANLFLLVDGELLTPRLLSGVLPGIIRGIILEQGLAREKSVLPGDVRRAEAALVTNSLIRVAGVSEIKGLEYEPDLASLEAVLREIRDALAHG